MEERGGKKRWRGEEGDGKRGEERMVWEKKDEGGKKGECSVMGEEVKGRWKHQSGALNAGSCKDKYVVGVLGGKDNVVSLHYTSTL